MQTKIITYESFLIISCHFCNMLHVIFIFYFRNATQQLQRNTVSLGEASQDSAHRPLKCRLVLMEMRKVNVIGHWIGHSDSLHLLYLMKVCCHTTSYMYFIHIFTPLHQCSSNDPNFKRINAACVTVFVWVAYQNKCENVCCTGSIRWILNKLCE